MNEDWGNIETMLQNNLTGRKVEVPQLVWDNVEKAITEKNKKRGFFWIWGAGVLSLLIISGCTLIYHFFFAKQDQVCYASQRDSSEINYLYEKYVLKTGFQEEENVMAFSLTDQIGIRKPDSSAIGFNSVDFSVTATNSKMDEGDDTARMELQDRMNVVANGYDSSLADGKQGVENNDRVKKEQDVDLVNVKLKDDATDFEDISVNEVEKPGDDFTVPVDHNGDQNELVVNAHDSLPEISTVDSVMATARVETDTANNTVQDQSVASLNMSGQMDETAKWSIYFSGGYSSFDMAVFKPEFRSGALSNRTFKSGGSDFKLGGRYDLTEKITLGLALNYNWKNTRFNYAVRTDDQGYFEHIIKGNPLPVEEINDDDQSCNCYLIEDVSLQYGIQTLFTDLTAQFYFLKTAKLEVAGGVSVGTDLTTRLRIKGVTPLAVQNRQASFSVLKAGLGIEANYKIGNRLGVVLRPDYQFIVPVKDHPFYSQRINEMILSAGLLYKF